MSYMNAVLSSAATEALRQRKSWFLGRISTTVIFHFSCSAVWSCCVTARTRYSFFFYCWYLNSSHSDYTADVVSVSKAGRHLVFYYRGTVSAFFLFESVTQEMRDLHRAPSQPSPHLSLSFHFPESVSSVSLSLSLLRSTLLTNSVMRPLLSCQDEEEDEEGELMSDHMKDSEVTVPLFAEALMC